MKIKNINGTAGNKCKCGTWLQHWEKFAGRSLPTFCAEKNCSKTDLVGAHVQKDSAIDRSWYIVPLCSGHNRTANEIEILDTIPLVSANVTNTCK